MCINALEMPFTTEENAKPDSGDQKIRRHELARHVIDPKDTYEFKSEDIVLLKQLINKVYNSPLVVGQAWSALERPSPLTAQQLHDRTDNHGVKPEKK